MRLLQNRKYEGREDGRAKYIGEVVGHGARNGKTTL